MTACVRRWTGRAQGDAGIDTGLRLVAAVYRFWMVRGHLREGRAWAEDLLALEAASASAQADSEEMRTRRGTARAGALLAAGVLALYQSDDAAAEAWLEAATALAQQVGALRTAGYALNSLGVMGLRQGDAARAGVRLEASLALMRELGEPRGAAAVLCNLGLAF